MSDDVGGTLGGAPWDRNEEEEFIPEDAPTSQLLIAISRELRATRDDVRALRLYAGIVTLLIVALVVLLGLIAFGVVTLDVHAVR